MHSSVFRLVAIGLLLLTCLQLSARRESSQPMFLVTIDGVVSDTSGNPIPNAEVRISNLSMVPALTDENGCYHIQRVIGGSGILIIRYSKPGYVTMTKPNLIFHADGTHRFVVDATLPEQP